jgi:ferric-dicitrate binding protein FerR (iron transport regulator)
MPTPNHNTLIELLLAGELSPQEQRQLCELIADDTSMQDEVLDQMWLEPLLRDSFQSDPDGFVQKIEAVLDGDDNDTTQFTERVVDAWTERSARRSRRRFIGGALVAACVAVAIVAGVLFYPNGTGSTVEAAPQPRLQQATGDVTLVAFDGRSRSIVPGTRIEPGDTITTTGESSATVSWDDNARITLTRDASLTWPTDESDMVKLNSGLALVDRSSPGASKPVVFVTQHATVELPDTNCVLATSDRQTDVTVQRGKVLMTCAGRRAVEVSKGQCGVTKGQTVELRKGSATPDTWSEDFESGLPEEWKSGELATDNLPQGCRGAVRTQKSRDENGDACHQIWTCSQWEHGLAVVHEDTCLNFVYRFKKADTVQVLTLLRSPSPDSPVQEVQVLKPSDVPDDEQWWKIPSHKWYTVSIPLSRLSNPESRKQPTTSSIATAFNFRPQNHACGLVIDRMWLARGTSQKIVFKPLETNDEEKCPPK